MDNRRLLQAFGLVAVVGVLISGAYSADRAENRGPEVVGQNIQGENTDDPVPLAPQFKTEKQCLAALAREKCPSNCSECGSRYTACCAISGGWMLCGQENCSCCAKP